MARNANEKVRLKPMPKGYFGMGCFRDFGGVHMSKFQHDLALRSVKILDVLLITLPFCVCWYEYYGSHITSPYYAKGNLLIIALYFMLYIIMGRIYDGFWMSMQRISEIIYGQVLAAAVCDGIMYIIIWLLSKKAAKRVARFSGVCNANCACIGMGIFCASLVL